MSSLIVILLFVGIPLLRAIASSRKTSARKKQASQSRQNAMHKIEQERRKSQTQSANSAGRQAYQTAQPNRPEPGTPKPRLNQPEPGRATAVPNRPKPGTPKPGLNRPEPGTVTASLNRPEPGTPKPGLNRPEPGTVTAKPNVPRKEKQNLQQRFDTYKEKKKNSAKNAASVFAEMDGQEDILSAARENTVEVEQDNDKDALMAANSMEEIFDLMVKGPKDTLSGQRDFVSEAMDMLNQYGSLPDSGMLSEYL